MSDAKDILVTMREVLDLAAPVHTETSDRYEVLGRHVLLLQKQAQEALQAKLQSEGRPILRKLEAGKELTDTEWDVVKLLIIGDAQYYVKYENDVTAWENEVARMAKEIAKLREKSMDELESLLHLKAACEDAMKVLPDLTFYTREKERIERFETTRGGRINKKTGQFLADFIRYALASERI